MTVTASSSAVIPFPEPKRQGFAAVSKAWLSPLLADKRLTHGETRLASKLYLYIDQKRREATGQLESRPGWERLIQETTLSKSSIDRGLKKFERINALKILHGEFDPNTGRRLPNKYVHVSPVTPGPGVKSRCQNPGVTGDTRLGDRDSVNISKRADQGLSLGTLEGSKEGRGCPRAPSGPEGSKQASNQEGPTAPPDNPLPASPPQDTEGVPRVSYLFYLATSFLYRGRVV